MKIALSILGISILLAISVGAYLYQGTPASDPQLQYSDTKKAAMAARAEKQAQANIVEERMIEAVSASKSSMKKADMTDVLKPQN